MSSAGLRSLFGTLTCRAALAGFVLLCTGAVLLSLGFARFMPGRHATHLLGVDAYILTGMVNMVAGTVLLADELADRVRRRPPQSAVTRHGFAAGRTARPTQTSTGGSARRTFQRKSP